MFCNKKKAIKIQDVDLPFLWNNGRNNYCDLLDKSKNQLKEDEDFDPITPIFCPLKKKDVIVKFEQ